MRFVIAGLALLLTGCVSLQPSLSDNERIRVLTTEYTSAWQAGHSGLIMSMLTDDAVLMPHHGGEPIEGRDSIREFWFPDDQPTVIVERFHLDPREISVDRNTAFARGKFELAFNWEQDGRVMSASNKGNFLMVLRRERDLWKIARYIWNDPLPQVTEETA
ncbi:MAG: DUF4440 domain-containing protein [Gammaproteobacteria bacterium]|nr:DUF4440 domain-containing protein [Gammaproteobacteria bacterium]NND59043.1 DUF4440 domain-containing protein [Gammaproteobacteria bacterium]